MASHPTGNGQASLSLRHCSYFAKCIGLRSFQLIVHPSAFNHLQHETIITLILQFDLCISCLQTCILNALVFSLERSSMGSLWGELIGKVLKKIK